MRGVSATPADPAARLGFRGVPVGNDGNIGHRRNVGNVVATGAFSVGPSGTAHAHRQLRIGATPAIMLGWTRTVESGAITGFTRPGVWCYSCS